MSNNITSGSNLIVSNDATIGKNLFVSGTSSLGTMNSANATINILSASDANINNIMTNNLVVNGLDILDYMESYSNNNNNSNTSNIMYELSTNKTTISGNTFINDLTAGTIDANIIKLNGANVIDSLTNGYTSYVDTKISDLIGSAPASLDTLKEISDLLTNNNNNSLSQTLVSSISGINSSITTLQNNVTLLQTNDTIQTNVNTSVNNSINNINSTLSGIDSKLLTVNSNIANLQSADTTQATTNTTVANNINTLNNSCSDLNSKVLANSNNIIALQATNTVQATTNTTVTNNINTLNNSFTDLNSKVVTLTSNNTTNTNNINTLTNSINNLDAKIDTNQTSVQSTVTALNSEIDSLQASINQTLTNFSYSNGKTRITDLIVDDAIITTLKSATSTTDTLLIGSTNVMTALNGISQTLTGIVYEANQDITYINNHVILPNSNTLYIGDTTYSVKSKIDEKSLLTGNNSFSGTNTFQSDTVSLKITTKNNPSLNNALTFQLASANSQFNDLVKVDDMMLWSGVTKDNIKNSIFIGPWATGSRGIRISSSKFEVAPGIIETPSSIIDASTSKVTIKPQGYNGGLDIYTTNSTDASLKTLKLSISDGGISTSGYTSLNNGNLVLLDSNTHSNKNIIMKNKVLLLENATGRSVQLYQNNDTFSIDNSYMNSSRISMSVRGAGTYDANNNPTGTNLIAITIDSNNTAINNNTTITGTLTTTAETSLCNDVVKIQPSSITMNKDVTINGFLKSSTFNTYVNASPTISNPKTTGQINNSILMSSMTVSGSQKRKITTIVPISFARSALILAQPINTSLDIETSLNGLTFEVRKNNIVQAYTSDITFTFSETLPKSYFVSKYYSMEGKTYTYELYAGYVTIVHTLDTTFNTNDLFTYYVSADVTNIARSETFVYYYMITNTDISTETHSSQISYVTGYSLNYISPSYASSLIIPSNLTTGLIETNLISSNTVTSNNIISNNTTITNANITNEVVTTSNVTTANIATANITNAIITNAYIKNVRCKSFIAGYLVDGAKPFNLSPIFCSLKGITPLNVDDYYIVLGGYKFELFDALDYLTPLETFTNNNADDSPQIFKVALNNANLTSSIKVWFKAYDDTIYREVTMQYLSY